MYVTTFLRIRIMPRSFLVNYGGPGGATLSSMSSQYNRILEACKKKYGGTPKATGFTLNGLDVTYYQIGVHRMIKVELPDSVKHDLKSMKHEVRSKAAEKMQLYSKVFARASDFNTHKYALLSNNCVSAVANVLNTLEPSILAGQKKIVPQLLDSKIRECTKKESLMFDALNASKQEEDGITIKPLYSGGVPSKVWDEVMTSPQSDVKSSADKQVAMKAKLRQLKQEAQSEKTPSPRT
jgi:hypothetical protein